MEVDSLKLVETCVAEGYGIGLFLDVPGHTLASGLRAIPLPDFTPLDYGLVWRGRASPVILAIRKSVQGRLASLMKPAKM